MIQTVLLMVTNTHSLQEMADSFAEFSELGIVAIWIFVGVVIFSIICVEMLSRYLIMKAAAADSTGKKKSAAYLVLTARKTKAPTLFA